MLEPSNFFLSMKNNTINFLQKKNLKKLFQRSETYDTPNSRLFIRIIILNTLSVVYTLFALPLYVAYGIDSQNWMVIVFEVMVSVGSALRIYLNVHSFRKNIKTIKTKHYYLNFIFKTDFLFDFIGLLPLYLLLSKIFYFLLQS